jgi:hypothetical protein
MKIMALDLTREYPRSPREKLGGYVHLARMIDKARAKATSTLGEYIYPCPLDQLLLELVKIPSDAFYEAVKERDDGEILDWLKKNAKNPSPDDVKNWNQAFLNRKPQSEEGMRHFLEIRDKFAPHRKDITTWVDLLDLEEGRAQDGP